MLGAITLHTIVAASLLQPIKWHMKRAVNELSDNKGESYIYNYLFIIFSIDFILFYIILHLFILFCTEFKKEIVNDDNIRPGDIVTDSFDKKQTKKLSDLNDDVKKNDFHALEIIEETNMNQVVLIRRNSG